MKNDYANTIGLKQSFQICGWSLKDKRNLHALLAITQIKHAFI